MKNLFTRFLMIVFLFGIFFQAYAVGAPVAPPPAPTGLSDLTPDDNSDDQALPGKNVLVMTFSKDLHPTQPFGSQGVWALVWESQSLGYQQLETVLYQVGGPTKIEKVGSRTVKISFATELKEQETYHVTIESDAIRFADGTWFAGLSYNDLSNVPPVDPEWDFTVKDVTKPEMVDCDDINNVNGEFGVSIDQAPIVLCFNEPVQWAPGVDPYKIGNIAFYLATKENLDPNTEFGGDVLYASAGFVEYYYNGIPLVGNSQTKSGSVNGHPGWFDKAVIFPKDDQLTAKTKSAPIGNHVWPVDRDIYLRFAAGLIVDLAGNPFDGVDGSPFDPYAVNGQQYWFSTRAEAEIGSSAIAVLETSAFPVTPRVDALWENDDIVVTINSDDLEFISDVAITTGNVNQFIKLSVDGVNVPYTVHAITEGSGVTKYLLEPGNLPHKKTLKVDLLGGIIRDNGDLRIVPTNDWEFNTGDFTAPVINGTINNQLCTNFDLRINYTAPDAGTTEAGVVYYAIRKDTTITGWEPFPMDITPDEILKGQVKRVLGTYPNKYDYYWHFYHVSDAGVYGKTGVDERRAWSSSTSAPVNQVPPTITGWQKDSFNIAANMIAFEHIDDFTNPNHGDKYNVYYFAVDKPSEGPYNNPVGTSLGRTTGVTTKAVQLTDCLQPNLIWWFDDIKRPNFGDDLWDACPVDSLIKKQGKFKLDFAAGSQTEGIKLVNSSLTWMDVVKLEVEELAPFDTWVEVDIASITPTVVNGKVMSLVVTPLNSYPSGGQVMITLASGSVQDYAGNAINTPIICTKNIEVYADPWVATFTIENKTKVHPLDLTCPDTDTKVALRNGKITLQFNNPIFTPKRDLSSGVPNLVPISLDPDAINYVGKYVKLREGSETGAEVTDNISDIQLSFELYGYNSSGQLVLLTAPINQGVVKIVATPQSNYKTENWYYVELEKDLQDINLRELSYVNAQGTWDNNLFTDIHEQYCPYPTTAFTGVPPYAVVGNSANYFMRFKSEDTVSPELHYIFEKFAAEDYPGGASEMPYIELADSATVVCTDPNGGFGDNTIPVGAIITEWSKLGFADKDLVIEDPNMLRPYFKMKNSSGVELPFDVVVLNVYLPGPGPATFTNDAVWFGFVPFTTLAEGQSYTMVFNPNYQAPQSGQPSTLPEGPVFVDDNGNPLSKNTIVNFRTCSVNPLCITDEISTPTSVFGGKKVAGSLTPTFTITSGETVTMNGGVFSLTEVNPTNNAPLGTTYLAGVAGVLPSPGISSSGNVITINFSAFASSGLTTLGDNKKYLVTLPVDGTIGITGYPANNLLGCGDTLYFWSPDKTVPAVAAISPDIDWVIVGTDVANNLGQLADQIDPRKPGELRISWNEKVSLQVGKTIEVWENGTTKRVTYTIMNPLPTGIAWDATNNMLKLTLPKDFLNYYSATFPTTGHFHVDVKAGLVKDLQGNESAQLTGPVDGITTWTFQTGTNIAPTIVNWTPKCTVEPGAVGTVINNGADVQLGSVSVTISEGAVPVAGKKLYIRAASGGTDLYAVNVTSMTSTNQLTYSVTPSTPLVLPNNGEYKIFVEAGAFKETYPLTNQLSTPDYDGANYLNSVDACTPALAATFKFADTTPPTVVIWPVQGDTLVAFNAHGYIKLSEQVVGRLAGSPDLVITQSNIKNWVKVSKETAVGSGTYVDLSDAEYVCEFVDELRTHIRVTFLDEQAPAINGVTANMMDEWKYMITVNALGTNGYTLEDFVGNDVVLKTSTFTTEDITAPKFYVTTCDVTASSIKINFTPWQNVDPYAPQVRTYPAELGKVFYVVRPYGTVVTASDLYNKVWTDVKELSVPAAGKSATWNFDANLPVGYNYTVYAVMQDNETDKFIAPSFGNAWPTTNSVFVGSGDTDPATGAIGLADIRTAPNKNMTVGMWNFCFCDDDKPVVVSKSRNGEINVPVTESFKIKFNEPVALGPDVLSDGTGTGGTVNTPEYGYEVRLRDWNTNLAVPIILTLGADSSLTVDPASDLPEETRFYIEIDRWVITDMLGANCSNNANVALPSGFTACSTSTCTNPVNYFPGWIGRDMWWFQTTDNTPPVLTGVSPLGNCVPVANNQIRFTFTEKNEMVVNTLTGQDNNIYVYKVGSTVPYEIINAHSATPVRVNGNTWTITYTTVHPYNSEEQYYVLWEKDIFVDNAVPTKHAYTESLTEVTDYALDTDWQQFMFETEDALKPVASWSFVNRMWETLYPGQVYSLSNGSYDSNPDGLGATKDVCAEYAQYGGVPTSVGMYVWFNEPVTLVTVAASPAGTYNDRWMNANFYLTSPTAGNITLAWGDNGVAPIGGLAIPGGVTIPEGAQWYYVKPQNGTVASLTNFDFGIKANVITDNLESGEATTCRRNTLPMLNLFDFCTWDETPPTAQLFDGKDHEILVQPSTTISVDTCIAEREYILLKFSKPVVKTMQVTLPPQFGSPNPGNPFWTYSNLFLTEDDLKDTDGQIFTFRNVTDNEYVVIRDVDIIVQGKEYKLWLDEPMDSEDMYVYSVRDSVLKDMTRIPNGNFYPGQSWDWYVTDWIPPYIVSTTPADEAQNVSPVNPLTIVFNERVVLGTEARIIIRDNGQPQGVVYNFRADDAAHVTLMTNRTTVVVNHAGLDKNTTYYVQIEPGFVYEQNCSNLAFDGKSEQGSIKDSWNFSTGDADGPVANLWPVPGDGCVEVDANLVMTFDENIDLTNDGQVVIYKAKGDQWHNPNWPNAMFGDVVAVIPLTTSNFPQIRITGSNGANGLTGNVITVTPPAGVWESDATYYVRVTGNGHTAATEASVVEDALGNPWMYPVSHPSLTLLNGIHHNQWYFKIGNNDEPVLESNTPVRGEVVVAGVASAVTDLSMTFEDEVAFGSGKIQVWEFIVDPQGGVAAQESNLWKEYNIPADVLSGKISLSGNTVTVNDVELLDGINWYYVLVTPGAITNNVECTLRGWSGISNPDTWLFSTAPDITDPTMAASEVTSDACSNEYLEPATVAFKLTFSEGVSVANASPNNVAKIFEVGGTAAVATATITPAMISGNVLTLNISDFVGTINDQKSYNLVIGGNAIHDLATASLAGTQNPFGRVPFGNENWFEGVTILFMTGDFTAPTAVSFSPNAVADLENEVTLVVAFSEDVKDGAGMMKLYNASTDEMIASFDAANDLDTNPKTVTVKDTLNDLTGYYVLIDKGFVTDMLYMGSCDTVRDNVAVTDKNVWKFAIDDNTVPAIVEDLTQDITNLMKTFHIKLKYNDVITAVDASKAQLTYNGSPVNGVTGAEINGDLTNVIIHVTVANDQREYKLSLDAGFVMDDAIKPNSSLAEVTGPYMVGDRTAPILEAKGPEGILPSYIGVSVMVDWFDNTELTVKKPIIIKNSAGTTVATWTPVLDAEQKASFSPALWFDVYTVEVPAGAVADVNGNENDSTSWTFSVVDNVAPNCMTIISPKDGETCVKKDIELTMEFCERVAPGDSTKLVKVYNILEENGLPVNMLVYSTPVTAAMINGETVKIPVNGLVDNVSFIVMIDADAIRDEAGNTYQGITDPITWNFTTGDNTAPTVTLVPAGSTNNKNEIVVNSVFSEPVLGAEANIKVTGATSYTVKVSASDSKIYEVSIVAADSATVIVTVPVTITDVNCNNNPLAAEVNGTFVVGDNTAPTVEVTSAPEDAMNTLNTFNVVLTFSEKVKGVADALATSVGMTGVTTTDSIVYTVAFAGADETVGKLVLDSTKVSDMSQNENKLVAGISWDYKVGDHVVPTADVVPAANPSVTTSEQLVTVTFSEDVIVPAGGIVVTNGTAMVTNEGMVYTVSISAADGATAKLDLTSLITDDSKNANKLAPASYTYTFADRTAPMVTVYKPSAKDTIKTFDVTISFNEKVTGVSTSSVKLTGNGAVLGLRTIVDGWAYEATITGAEQSTLTLAFTNAIKDLAGNALIPVEFKYTIGDFTAPTVTADPASGVFVTNKFDVTLTFNEDVTGVASAVKVSKGSAVVTGSGKVYTVAITAPSLSEVILTVGKTVKDMAGNAIVEKEFTYGVTGIVPIATIQGQGDASAHVGTKLQVKGTVTGVSVGEGFFLQDAVAAWSGIWVEDSKVTSATKIGDGVIITGEVAEIASVTSIMASSVEVATGTPAITAIKVTPTDAKAEKYESVLVMVEGARADEANSSGQWNIYLQVTDNVMVNDWIYTYNPVKGQYYDVTGVVNGRLDAFKIEPRMASDIVDLKPTPIATELTIEFKVYPNPFSEYIQIDNNDKLARVVILNIAGQKVIDIEYPENRIRTANLVSGVYLVNLFTEDGIVKTERIIKR